MDDTDQNQSPETEPEATSAPAETQAYTPEEQTLIDRYSSTFIGSYSHTLDTKGRIIVPQAFRDALGAHFYIGPTFNFQGIALYPNLVWAGLRDSYAKLGHFNKSLNIFLEQFDAMSYRDQECDSQGRVLVPSKIRQRILGDEKDVEITGANDHVRIATRSKCEAESEDFMQKLPDILDEIGRLSAELGIR